VLLAFTLSTADNFISNKSWCPDTLLANVCLLIVEQVQTD